MNVGVTRHEFAALAGAALLAPPASAKTGELNTRAIPGSGERLPAVGLGSSSLRCRSRKLDYTCANL
jgi:hypothetical protein